jgi:BirA family biotin operon repressor/biotin-[acetyl-CoA-carboxylase] ligase
MAQWIVLGIGINVTAPDEGYPDDIRQTAGAIFAGDEPAVTRNRLAMEVAKRILDADDGRDSRRMLDEYRQRLMGIGRKVVVTGLAEPFEALAVGVDDTGRLLVKKDGGETIALFSGEVSVCGTGM